MKDALTKIITDLVDEKDAVSIDEDVVEGVDTYTIHVAKADMGKIIGKEGKVIRSIRNVMKVRAMKEGKRINIQLSENE